MTDAVDTSPEAVERLIQCLLYRVELQAALTLRAVLAERDAALAEVARLRGLLYEARYSGLIYWQPQTNRGRVAMADMLQRIDAALATEAPHD